MVEKVGIDKIKGGTMDNKKFKDRVFIAGGVMMFILSLCLSFALAINPVPLFTKIGATIFSNIIKTLSLPLPSLPIFILLGLVVAFLFFLRTSVFSNIALLLVSFCVLIFALPSFLYGYNFFDLISKHQINLSSFFDHSFIKLFVLILSFFYMLSAIFLFKLKNKARIIINIISVFSILYFLPLCISLFYDPWGWGGLAAIYLMTYIIFPAFFLIFLNHPKVKQEFKK